MRALSANTRELIDELYRLADEPVSRGNQAARQAIAVLERIADLGEPLAIPWIIACVLNGCREIAEAAGQVVQRLRLRVGIRDLGLFDRAFRATSLSQRPGPSRWRRMAPDELRSVATLQTGPVVLQLAMCHPSGHVREAAIRRSATCADGSEIPFLLLRTNDWVLPVRELAQAALRARLGAHHLPDLVAALPVLDEMPRWGRLGDTALIDDIHVLLGSAAAVPALRAALSSPDRFVRRGAFRRLIEREASQGDPQGPYRESAGGLDPRAEVVAGALRDADPAIRTWVERWLIAGSDRVFLAFSEALLRSRLGANRLAAARRLPTLDLAVPWRELLFDDHAGVRALAQQTALDAGGEPDVEYRARLATSRARRLGVALIGLSETGGGDDATVMRGYLTDRLPAVRRGALGALVHVEVDDAVELCLASLDDGSPSVSHAAHALLAGRIASLGPAQLWTVFQRVTTVWGRSDALALLSLADYWTGMPYLLRAFCASEGVVKDRAAYYLGRRIERQHRMFTPPSPSTADEIRATLDSPALPEALRRELSTILDSRLRHVTRSR
jgi:hypothetical protein